jgi:hypothetical protein
MMKISGFTFIRNAVKYDFPVVEAINSILPIVDEFVVNVGKSVDGTLELIRNINDPRIKIVESVWDESLKKDGKIFGIQQDIALSHCSGDWAFLVQGDEVVHQDDLPTVRHAIEQYDTDQNVLGLVLKVIHFKGDYWSVDPWMYRKATRVIRNNRGLRSTADCCDFRTAYKEQMIKSGPYARLIKARVFHYGWVKHPTVLKEKLVYQQSRHDGERLTNDEIEARTRVLSQFPNYDIMKSFSGMHPKVMHPRIRGTKPIRARRNRWLNWRFYQEIARHGFKG